MLTPRRLNRATLDRQLLLQRAPLPVVDGVRRVVALQAQEAPSPYIALWNRLAGFDPADLDAAYAEHEVVKATLLRITLHAVAADDYPAFQHAMASSLRAARLKDKRFKATGLTVPEADALVEEVLANASAPRTNADMEAWVESRLGAGKERAWWAMRSYAPFVHAPTGGPWSHGPRPAYVAARVRPPTGDPLAAEQHLVRRYLEGFGPASAQDIGQFTILRQPVVRAALVALVGAGEVVTVDGLHDVAGASMPDEDVEAPPRLLAMWDSVLLAYKDRSRIIPEPFRKLVIRTNGDVLPTLLVDGHVAGVWRPVDGRIEATAFAKLPKAVWSGLAEEASSLLAMLEPRDSRVYARYARWWPTLPAAQVRLLPA